MAGRTMTITHKGQSILVLEGHTNECVLKFNDHREPTDKKFPAACRQAVTWLLDHAGEMQGTYSR